jgi:hypothetical protein
MSESVDGRSVELEDVLRADPDAQLATLAALARDLDGLECIATVRHPIPPARTLAPARLGHECRTALPTVPFGPVVALMPGGPRVRARWLYSRATLARFDSNGVLSVFGGVR